MVLQQDKGSAPPPFDTGLPRTQSSEDVPRWLVVLGIVAACTLLVALLRYAIDLLGVVFLIILVGFSIRAVSDWLTEGESVSAWALAAVFAGLFGTVLVGLWLFGSRDMTTGALERGLPAPVLTVADWLETHGWGQRVLLSGGGLTAPSAPGVSAPSGGSSSPSAPSSPRAEPQSPPSTPREASAESPSRQRKESARAGGDEAEAATRSSSSLPSRSASRVPEASGGSPEAPGQAATSAPPSDPSPSTEAAAEPSSIGTTISLVSSHSTSTVGVSVRFTATVTADGSEAPTGIVAFYDGDRAMGTAPVHGTTAVFSTLDLSIGDHQITAQFHGARGFLGSRSEPISQTITRR